MNAQRITSAALPGDAATTHEPHRLAQAQGIIAKRRHLPECGEPNAPICEHYAECLRRQLQNVYWHSAALSFVLPECEQSSREDAPPKVRQPHPARQRSMTLVMDALTQIGPCSANAIAAATHLFAGTARKCLRGACEAGTARIVEIRRGKHVAAETIYASTNRKE